MKLYKFSKFSLIAFFMLSAIIYAVDIIDNNSMEDQEYNKYDGDMQHDGIMDNNVNKMHKDMKNKKCKKEGNNCKSKHNKKCCKECSSKNIIDDENEKNSVEEEMKSTEYKRMLSPSERMLYAMHKPMMTNNTSNSKNIDLDFLENMIPHHQGAIDSSKLYLEFGSNEKLKEIAQNIINSQEEEIRFFIELIERNDKDTISVKYDQYNKETKEAMASTMNAINKVKPSDNIDLDFVKSMIEHHQGAIDSSNILLKYGESDEIREVASSIIKEQNEEIKLMQEVLKAL